MRRKPLELLDEKLWKRSHMYWLWFLPAACLVAVRGAVFGLLAVMWTLLLFFILPHAFSQLADVCRTLW